MHHLVEINPEIYFGNDAGYFTSVTPSAEQQSRGIVWVKKITRFILPFSNFTPEDDDSKAITFKVDLEERHSPSCYLKIQTAGVSGVSRIIIRYLTIQLFCLRALSKTR